jgi:hypothetical protein
MGLYSEGLYIFNLKLFGHKNIINHSIPVVNMFNSLSLSLSLSLWYWGLHLSHSSTPIFVMGFFEIGPSELFA